MDAVSSMTDPEHQCDRAAAVPRPCAIMMRVVAASLIFFLPCFGASVFAADSLPVLHTARQAHTLPTVEAIKGYPVHIDRAQITFCNPTISCLFVMDATDGIFVDSRGDKVPPLTACDIVTILLQSPADVPVLSWPSWCTPRNTLILAALLFAVAAIVVAWNVGLRRRVRAQTHVIRTQLEEAHSLRVQAEAAHREKSESLANVLSLQRDLLDAQEKLRYQATHDMLTGLWNRGALLDLLRNEIERAVRTHSSMGVLMLDVDHFKPVNDTLGHLTGDEVLKEIARRISYSLRSYDMAGRYGGEEFLVLLPGCGREETESGAERIRAAIASAPFHIAGSEISLTISIGATVAPECGDTESGVLSLADVALYQAKRAGRNCTILRNSFQEEHTGTA